MDKQRAEILTVLSRVTDLSYQVYYPSNWTFLLIPFLSLDRPIALFVFGEMKQNFFTWKCKPIHSLMNSPLSNSLINNHFGRPAKVVKTIRNLLGYHNGKCIFNGFFFLTNGSKFPSKFHSPLSYERKEIKKLLIHIESILKVHFTEYQFCRRLIGIKEN